MADDLSKENLVEILLVGIVFFVIFIIVSLSISSILIQSSEGIFAKLVLSLHDSYGVGTGYIENVKLPDTYLISQIRLDSDNFDKGVLVIDDTSFISEPLTNCIDKTCICLFKINENINSLFNSLNSKYTSYYSSDDLWKTLLISYSRELIKDHMLKYNGNVHSCVTLEEVGGDEDSLIFSYNSKIVESSLYYGNIRYLSFEKDGKNLLISGIIVK